MGTPCLSLSFYIIYYSKEETKNVFYYSLKYSVNGDEIKSESTRCAPIGISDIDAIDNNFTTIIPEQIYISSDIFSSPLDVLLLGYQA